MTTSILPIVENYRDHSNQVWEGSKFWKQFFEASANVSLSGYEEPPPDGSEVGGDEDDEEGTTTASRSAGSAQATPSSASYVSPPAAHNGAYDQDDLTPKTNNTQYLATAGDDSPSHSQNTPRPSHKSHKSPQTKAKTSKAPYTSPYESLKRATLGASPSDSDVAPSTPRAQASPSKSAQQQQQQQSSPFAPPSTYRQAAHRTPGNNKNDVLLHRVLDKTWRIQATPHSTARLPYRAGSATDQSPARPSTARKAARQRQQERPQQRGPSDDDLDSSPAAPAPELHAEIFDTPARKGTAVGPGAGRVPGVSVLTPAKGTKKTSTPARSRKAGDAKAEDKILWDSDDEDEGAGIEGMSPPKTMQFHVPQSRLVQTPGEFFYIVISSPVLFHCARLTSSILMSACTR